MEDISKNIEQHYPNKKQKIMIVFDDMVAEILCNKKLNPIVSELFINRAKINIFLVFIRQSSFAVSKHIRLNSTHYLVIKIPNINELLSIIDQILTLKTL